MNVVRVVRRAFVDALATLRRALVSAVLVDIQALLLVVTLLARVRALWDFSALRTSAELDVLALIVIAVIVLVNNEVGWTRSSARGLDWGSGFDRCGIGSRSDRWKLGIGEQRRAEGGGSEGHKLQRRRRWTWNWVTWQAWGEGRGRAGLQASGSRNRW